MQAGAAMLRTSDCATCPTVLFEMVSPKWPSESRRRGVRSNSMSSSTDHDLCESQFVDRRIVSSALRSRIPESVRCSRTSNVTHHHENPCAKHREA